MICWINWEEQQCSLRLTWGLDIIRSWSNQRTRRRQLSSHQNKFTYHLAVSLMSLGTILVAWNYWFRHSKTVLTHQSLRTQIQNTKNTYSYNYTYLKLHHHNSYTSIMYKDTCVHNLTNINSCKYQGILHAHNRIHKQQHPGYLNACSCNSIWLNLNSTRINFIYLYTYIHQQGYLIMWIKQRNTHVHGELTTEPIHTSNLGHIELTSQNSTCNISFIPIPQTNSSLTLVHIHNSWLRLTTIEICTFYHYHLHKSK